MGVPREEPRDGGADAVISFSGGSQGRALTRTGLWLGFLTQPRS